LFVNYKAAAPEHPTLNAGTARAGESPNLDFLRSIAVLAVFSRHFEAAFGYNPHIPLGSFGVMIFFVHTSLVLMMSLERIEFSGRSLFKTFYVRRLFRIYPLSMLCVAVIALIPPHPELSTFLANFFLCMNVFYKSPLNPVLWSLPYEVQMYLVLPILYLVGKKYRIRGIVIVWFGAVIIAMIQPHVAGRLDIAMYAPCFLAGVASYFIGYGVRPRRVPFILWPIIVVAGASIYTYGANHDFPKPGMWLMCMLIGITAPFFKELRMPLLRKSSAWIARYSYGIYLVHIYGIWAGIHVMRHDPLWIRSIVMLTVAFGVPVLLYHGVESPMIRLGGYLTRKKERGSASLALLQPHPVWD
jgi:peptidoglycan/LPS O-acetylase OafA/YrhL